MHCQYQDIRSLVPQSTFVCLFVLVFTLFCSFLKLNHNTNSKEVWQIISKFNGKPFKPVEVIKQDNVRYHENKDKANVLANHYQKTSSNDLLQPEFKDK